MSLTAPVGQAFQFHDGTSVSTLEQVHEKIKLLSPDEFSGFVSETKNDFASWCEHALGEPLLAERLRSTTNKEITLLKMGERLDEHLAQQNLYAIAEAKTKKIVAPETNASPKTPSINLALLHRKLLVKEFVIGIVLGIVLGVFIYHIIRLLVFKS
jgi:hypothetical protein